MKKYIELAEVELITLNTNDIVTASGDPDSIIPEYNSGDPTLAPSRYNYRGMETDWEDQDW